MILSLVYIIILSLFNQEIAKVAVPILVFIDPSVLGLFFIGGMVLLEKEQGIIELLYITPLKVGEYLLSKLLTLGILSIIAGVIIAVVVYKGETNFLLFISGILLTSILFTLIGFIISTRTKSINEYLVKIIPWMLIMIIPCFSLIPNPIIPKAINYLLNIIPSVAGLKLVVGAFYGLPIVDSLLYLLYLVIINVFLFIKTKRLFKKRVILNYEVRSI